jgi:hypothetical protein
VATVFHTSTCSLEIFPSAFSLLPLRSVGGVSIIYYDTISHTPPLELPFYFSVPSFYLHEWVYFHPSRKILVAAMHESLVVEIVSILECLLSSPCNPPLCLISNTESTRNPHSQSFCARSITVALECLSSESTSGGLTESSGSCSRRRTQIHYCTML